MKHDTYHTGYGRIVYDPHRPGMSKRTQWWCVVEADYQIVEYYQWWLRYEKHIHLQPPAWGAHISVIRGEKPAPHLMELWKKYHGQRVEFQYGHIGWVKTARSHRHVEGENSGTFYYVHVKCPLLLDIREQLQLKTGWDLHLTIGRTYEYQARKIGRNRRAQDV